MNKATCNLSIKRRAAAIKRHVGKVSDFRFFSQGKSARMSLADSRYQISSWGVSGQYPLCNLDSIGA